MTAMTSLSRFPGYFMSLLSSAQKACSPHIIPHITRIHKQSLQLCGKSSYKVSSRVLSHSCKVNAVKRNSLLNPSPCVENCKLSTDLFSTVACKTINGSQCGSSRSNDFVFQKLSCTKLKFSCTREMTHCSTELCVSCWNFNSNARVQLASSALMSLFRKSIQSTLHKPSRTIRHYSVSIQKNVSTALAVKRPTRKKPKAAEEGDDLEKVVAYAVSDELNLSQLKDALKKQGLYDVCELPIDAQDALYVQAKYPVDEKKREIYFFSDGSAVFWSMPELERKEVLKFLRKLDYKGCPGNHLKLETEEMDLKFSKGPSFATNDYLNLSEDVDDATGALEKYAFSNALAHSVKLAVWESALDQLIDSMEVVVEDLRNDQKIRMSRREVLRHTGELFALRHLINLSSDLLDSPDFYWDRPTLEKLYKAVYNHHDIAKRTKVMNEKLSYCVELTELLSGNLNDAHHTRLEVMIIILIMVEVVFEIIHYLERFIGG